MKIILGGGLVALLARDILGPSWTIIPVGRSMYYSFTPPLADNYIVKDTTIDDYMGQYTYAPIYTKTAFSVAGELTHNANIGIQQWLSKVYGDNIPPHADPYWRSHMEYFAYGDCCEIYRTLQDRYKDELIKNNEKWGKLITIKDHIVNTNNGSVEYDSMISAIPLYSLLDLLGITINLPSKDLWCYHLASDAFDFEGATHVLVSDPHIDFHRVTQLDNNNYVFYSSMEIIRPAILFMAMAKKFDLIGETQVPRAIPCGPIANIQAIKDAGITCIGKTASWDDCMDIGSCCKRLLRLQI